MIADSSQVVTAEEPARRLERLRQQLCAAETAIGYPQADACAVALGILPIDAVLGGGLDGGALHEIAAARETEIAAATAFALGLAARCVKEEANHRLRSFPCKRESIAPQHQIGTPFYYPRSSCPSRTASPPSPA